MCEVETVSVERFLPGRRHSPDTTSTRTMTHTIELTDDQIALLTRTLTLVAGATSKWDSFYVDDESAAAVAYLTENIRGQTTADDADDVPLTAEEFADDVAEEVEAE